jgi:hypothetical protein
MLLPVARHLGRIPRYTSSLYSAQARAS